MYPAPPLMNTVVMTSLMLTPLPLVEAQQRFPSRDRKERWFTLQCTTRGRCPDLHTPSQKRA